ncbi:restriction endonuclease subunit S [Lacrimispora indolis]|uniref:restriction endonuclease subunit S n=1 Tax=Lacrimispora indolis TaxID=69825 RepID=UPI0035616BC6
MTKQIHSGIAAGQVPEGYKLEHGYVIPKEWKVVHFNDCFHRLTQKNTENNQNVLTISAQQGLISQLDYYNTLYASEDKTGYFLLQKGNFAYNKSYSADYAYGAIKQLEKYDKGIVSPLYICFSANEGTNTDFYRQYFEAGMFNREIYKIAQEGARNHGLLNVSTPEFFSAALVFPPVDEQKKIAEILSCCDRVIELKQQLIAELQRLKSGFLQAMFPAKGHSEPDIRFPEFSDAWEQRKVTDLGEIYIGLVTTMTEHYTDEGHLLIRNSDIKEGYFEFGENPIYLDEEFSEQNKSRMHQLGDVITVHTGGIGTSAVIGENEVNSIGFATIVTRPNQEILDSNYFATYLNTDTHKQWAISMATGDGRSNYNLKDYTKLVVPIPQIGEQKKIAACIGNLNNLITLHQQELEETKKKKKSLAKLLLTGSVRVLT